MLIGTATAAEGIGASRATPTELECWYPNQKTGAGAGVAGGRLGGQTLMFAGGYPNEGANAGVGARADALGTLRSMDRARSSNRRRSSVESAFHRLCVCVCVCECVCVWCAK